MKDLNDVMNAFFDGNFLVITITKKEAEDGCVKYGACKVKATCEDCNGTGDKDKDNTHICKCCQGSGQITKINNVFLGTVTRKKVCKKCKGIGRITQNPCAACNGTGKIDLLIDVHIPAGTKDNDTISLKTFDIIGNDTYINVSIK